MRTAKTLIRLDGCLSGSESSLGAQVILLVLLYGGSIQVLISEKEWISSESDHFETKIRFETYFYFFLGKN